MKRQTLFAPLMFLLLAWTPVSAATLSSIVAYGDSLLDNGNLFGAVGQPGPPYVNGRASNGPVAVEYLAQTYGVPLLDFAWAGATTGLGNHLDPGGTPTSAGFFGLPGMTPSYLGSLATVAPIAPSSLFIIWGGANDFLSPSPADSNFMEVANRAVSNLAAIASGVQGLGAGKIVVMGLPDLGLTPYGRATGAAQASALSNYFNMQLMAALPAGVIFFDVDSLLDRVVANPSAYGLVNVTDPCFNASTGSVCSNPDEYLFFDDLHPTTRGHEIVADSVAAAIPEPSTFALSFLVLTLVVSRRARRLVGHRRISERQ